jgi:predicted aspartyl protease
MTDRSRHLTGIQSYLQHDATVADRVRSRAVFPLNKRVVAVAVVEVAVAVWSTVLSKQRRDSQRVRADEINRRVIMLVLKTI